MKKTFNSLKKELYNLYIYLYSKLGPQNWWPGESKTEIALGAILTQNTNWKNVEKAIANLKKEHLIDFSKIVKYDLEKLKQLIKPAGFYNQKVERIIEFSKFMLENYNGCFETEEELIILRNKLLSIKGVGKETADSIILYAFEKPSFVIDAYTKRLLNRHFNISEKVSYDELRALFMESLPKDVKIYNEYHALIVNIGKNYCYKRDPQCSKCPLSDFFK